MNTLARLDPGTDGWFLVLLGATALALIVAASGLLGRLLARRDPATSHAIDRVALLLILCLPAWIPLAGRSQLFTLTWPRHEAPRPEPVAFEPPRPEPPSLPLLPPAPEPEVNKQPPIAATPPPEPIAAIPAPEPVPAIPAPPPPAFEFDRPTLSGLAVAAWLTVSLLLTLRLFHGLMGLARLRRLAHPADPSALHELRSAFGPDVKPPPIFEVPGLPGPLAGGPISPAIYLPAGLPASLAPDALREILIHECAHAFRRDPLFGLLQRVATLLYWPHPAIHLLNRRLSRSREAVCDNHVLARSRRSSYARTLLTLAETTPRPPARRPAVIGLWETLEPLESRVRTILDERRPPVTRPAPLRTLTATLLITLLALPLAGLRLTPPTQAGEASPKAVAIVAIPDAPPAPPVADEPRVPFDPTFGDKTRTIIEGTVVDDTKTLSGIRVNGLWFRRQAEPAVSGAYGRFNLTLVGPPLRVEHLVAANQDGSLQGYATYRHRMLTWPGPVEIHMKPARKISVQVKDGSGKPLPGAHVMAHADGPLAEQFSDADGRATLLVPADARINAVVAHKDRVGMDYFLVDPYYFNINPSDLPPTITLRLTGARSASVRVVDEDNRPRSGLRIHAHGLSLRGKSDDLKVGSTEAMSAVTNAEGIATFHWLPRELRTQPRVGIWPWDGVEMQVVHLHPGSDTPVELRVASLVTFSGKVIQPDGKPLRGAAIGFCASPDRGDHSEGWTWTDSDGNYRIKVPPERMVSIALLERGTAASPIFGIPSLRGVTRQGLDLRVIEGGEFACKFVGPDDKPRAGTHLRVVMLGQADAKNNEIRDRGGERHSFTTHAFSGPTDSLRMVLAPGDYRISAHTDEMQSEEFEVTIAPGTRQDRTFRLAVGEYEPVWSAVSIAGVAFDASKDSHPPVPGAIITATPFGREMASPPEGTADEKGVFRFDVPREERMIRRRPSGRVVFSPDGTHPKALVIARNPEGTLAGAVAINDGANPIGIPLHPAGQVTGKLVKPDGSSDTGREVVLIQDYTGKERYSATFRTGTISDNQGRFRFDGILVGTRCTVFVIPLSQVNRGLIRPTDGSARGLMIERGGEVDLGTIRSAEEAKKSERPKVQHIRRVTSPPAQFRSPRERSGLNAMPFATSRDDIVKWIEIVNRDAPTQELIDHIDRITRPRFLPTRSPGQLGELLRKPSFLNLADRASQEVSGRRANTVELIALGVDYRVGYDAAFFAGALREIAAPSNAPILKGVVTDKATGMPIEGALVWSGRRAMATRTDAGGEFSIPFLWASRYLRVEADGYALEMPVVTRDGKPLPKEPLQVKLRPAEAATGQVVDERGEPIAGARLRAIAPVAALDGTAHGTEDEPGAIEVVAVTDEGGNYSFPGLPSGTELAWYAVEHPTYITPRGRQAKPKAGSFARLTLSRGCVLSGTVRDPEGKPVEGASVTIWGESGQVAETNTDHEGRFHLKNLPPHRYEAVVHGLGDLVTSASVEVKEGTPADVRIGLEHGRFLTGTVVNENGAPVPGVAVGWGRYLDPKTTVESFASFGPLTRTGAKGDFRLGPLPRRPLQLVSSRVLGRSSGSIAVRVEHSDHLMIVDTSLPVR